MPKALNLVVCVVAAFASGYSSDAFRRPRRISEVLVQVKGVSVEEVARATTEDADRLFRLAKDTK